MGEENLEALFEQADKIDLEEGLLAYTRYNMVLRSIADHYAQPLAAVVGAFCALSPNNDYTGNLRSLVTLLAARRAGLPFDAVTVSTYRHCGVRAWSYLQQAVKFEDDVKGLKIWNFYFNIMEPTDNRFVTIDGHMHAAWRGTDETMKEAVIRSPKMYHEIAYACKRLAFKHFMLPNQFQAVVWFTRKRVLGIKYNPQLDIFAARDDVWCTLRDVDDIQPFPQRQLEAA